MPPPGPTLPAMSTYNPFDVAAQQESVLVRGEQAERAALQADADMQAVMATLHGRRVLWRLIDASGVFRCVLADGTGLAFNEGARNVGLRLMAELRNAAPAEYLRMLEENHV